MNVTPFSPRPILPRLGEHIRIAVSPEDKAKLFDVAKRRGMTASELTRRALAAAINGGDSQPPLAA